MKDGNWIPLDKTLLKFLPIDREFSLIEAAFSLQIACDCKQPSTISGLACRWKWSRKRVSNFIIKMGAEIYYDEKTSNLQNQRGKIRVQIPLQIRSRSGADKEQIRIINSNTLGDGGSRSGTDKEQIGSRSGSTIVIPKPKPNNKEEKEEEGKKALPTPAKRFIPPSIEAVKEYCKERGDKVNPNTFHDYYESNGWMVGRNKMKSWQAAARKWEQSATNFPKTKGDVNNGFAERDYQKGATKPEDIPAFLR